MKMAWRWSSIGFWIAPEGSDSRRRQSADASFEFKLRVLLRKRLESRVGYVSVVHPQELQLRQVVQRFKVRVFDLGEAQLKSLERSKSLEMLEAVPLDRDIPQAKNAKPREAPERREPVIRNAALQQIQNLKIFEMGNGRQTGVTDRLSTQAQPGDTGRRLGVT